MLTKIRTLVGGFLNAVLAKPLARLVTAVGLPESDAAVALHFVVVLLVTFLVQVIGAYIGVHSEGSVTAVIYAAFTAALSTVGHKLLGLVPAPAAKATRKR